MTPWWTHSNYGQILQAYAMQQVLLSEGHDVYTIKYNAVADMAISDSEGKWFGAYFFAYLRQLLRYFLKDYLGLFDTRRFNDFKKSKLRFSSMYLTYSKLCKKYPYADAYITGSDQVWGPWFRLEPYFLGFGERKTIRIAYAGSFGREKLSECEIKTIAPLVMDMDYIGVREKSGIDIFKLIGNNSVAWVPDPILLLRKRDWEKVITKNKYFQENKNKIFVYIVGSDNNKEIKKAIDLLNKEGKSSVLCVSDSNDPLENIMPTIGDWLGLMQDADFIVTNSFHGTVFSLLFNKEFIVLARIGEKAESMNTRLVSLLKRMKLSSRLICKIDDDIIKEINRMKINWDSVNGEIDLWRGEGKDFICSSLRFKIKK